MSPTIDVNADLGEGCPWDYELLGLVSSASVCCGAHAGDPDGVRATLREAVRLGVTVGAHPGYDDRQGFGRRERIVGRDEVARLIVEQVRRLRGWADEVGTSIRFLKPHGALYNQAQREIGVAEGVLDAAVALGLPILGQPGAVLAQAAKDRGVRWIAEGFPDRRYRPDGRLVPRNEPDAMIYDPKETAGNVRRLLDRGVETLCVHGDDERAPAQAGLIRRLVAESGFTIRGLL